MTTCPKCKTVNPGSITQCPVCGSTLSGSVGSTAPAALWDAPQATGLWQAFWQSTINIIFRPRDFFRRMSRTGPLFPVILYGLLTSALGTIGAYFWTNLLVNALQAFLPQSIINLWQSDTSASTLTTAPLFALIHIVFGALFIHITLRLFARYKSSFGTSLRIVSYAQATMLLALIPFIGPVIAPIWSLWVLLSAVHAVAGISRFKAFMIMVLPTAILCLVLAVLIAVLLLVAGLSSVDLFKDFLSAYR